MNYNDQILENKAFNFFKQLMYNIALSICILLVGILIMVYGFKYQLYEVLSDSQAPVFRETDMVIVKAADKYEVGDILTYQKESILATHRIIGVYEKNGNIVYICHGDNTDSANPANGQKTVPYTEDVAFIQSLMDKGKTLNEIKAEVRTPGCDFVTPEETKGKVVNHIDNYGLYFRFIKDHYMLIVAMVAGIWCFSSVVQNELDIKRARRLI